MILLLSLFACIHPVAPAVAVHPCEGEGVHSQACEDWAVMYATCRSREVMGAPPSAVLEGMTETERRVEAAIEIACQDF